MKKYFKFLVFALFLFIPFMSINAVSSNEVDYSVDKYYRLERGYKWFKDEQPSVETKSFVEQQLIKENWNIDVVLSHTCPLTYEPREWFLNFVDQSTVDKSTEVWLDTIFSNLSFEKWYCGHYHGEKRIDKIEFLFESIKEF